VKYELRMEKQFSIKHWFIWFLQYHILMEYSMNITVACSGMYVDIIMITTTTTTMTMTTTTTTTTTTTNQQ